MRKTAPPPAPYVAGKRLQPVVLDAGDGAEVFAGFWDTELQLTCSFVLMTDGTYQCAPSTLGIPVFADASCSEMAVATCADVDGYATFSGGSCGGTVTAAYRLDGAVDGPGFSIAGPECVEQDPIFPVVRAAVPVATDSFVRGTLKRMAVKGGLGVARVMGDDGSAVTIGLTRDGYDCVPTLLDGDVRCLDVSPARRFDVPVYSDPSCSGQEVGLFGSRDCSIGPFRKPGLLAERSPTDACAPPKLFQLGDEIDHAYAASDQCRELQSDERFALVGPEIAPADLPLVSRVESGTGRLRAVSWGAGDTPLLGQGLFHDTKLDADCLPSRTASGQWRCAPQAYQSDLYADPDCTERLFPSALGTTDCSGEPARFATVASSSACDLDALYERGDPYDGDVYTYSDSPPGCQGPLPNNGKVYRLGAQIPTTELGLLTRTK